jgi:hypothetical protein
MDLLLTDEDQLQADQSGWRSPNVDIYLKLWSVLVETKLFRARCPFFAKTLEFVSRRLLLIFVVGILYDSACYIAWLQRTTSAAMSATSSLSCVRNDLSNYAWGERVWFPFSAETKYLSTFITNEFICGLPAPGHKL